MKNEPIKAYAYGVAPLFGSVDGNPMRHDPATGMTLFYNPYGYLYYWIDEHLQYQERITEGEEMKSFQYLTISNPRIRVELDGPGKYRILRK